MRILSIHSTIRSHGYRKTLGHTIRDWIDNTASFFQPIAKFLFPNFIAVHYFYIFTMVFVFSLLVLIPGNMDYIDCLFHAAGMATQAGLNTVNFNQLQPWQMGMFYIGCTLCTPIWIHGALAFVRLYWFERSFDGIRNWSKEMSRRRIYTRQMTRATTQGTNNSKGSKGNHNNPEDVYRSLAMMKEKQHGEDDQDGPALVVRGPAERYTPSERSLNTEDQPSNDDDSRELNLDSDEDSDIDSEVIDSEAIDSESEDIDADNTHEEGPTIQFAAPPTRKEKPQRHKKHSIIRRLSDDPLRRKIRTQRRRRRSSDEEALPRQNTMGSFRAGNPGLERTQTYLSWLPTVGRNSTFFNMTEEQKSELGGVEYRATKLLCKILVGYYVGFHLLGAMMLCVWIIHRPQYLGILSEDNVNPVWWGFFTSMSSFNDLGFTLTPDSMASFNQAAYPLLVCIFFIVIGNTGFPILLRFIIWVLKIVTPEDSLTRESLEFLLDHPRRCFTLLFPSAPTWWLFFILVALNGIDWVLFFVCDIHSEIFKNWKKGYAVLGGLFQAISTRTAGFGVVDLSQLHPAVQVSYMLMMYVSVLPIAISIRRTNVYEEKSLGIAHEAPEDPDAADLEKSTRSYIGAHLRKQLSFDLWFVFMGLFIVCLTEAGKIRDPTKPEFTVFGCLFEIVSAYGTVGMSLGYPNTNTALSAQFTVLGKLVVIAMMIRGRHRGLPYGLDRAVLLPHKLHDKDAEIASMRELQHVNTDDPVMNYIRKRGNKVLKRMKTIIPDEASHSGYDAEDEEHHKPLISRRGFKISRGESEVLDLGRKRHSTGDHSPQFVSRDRSDDEEEPPRSVPHFYNDSEEYFPNMDDKQSSNTGSDTPVFVSKERSDDEEEPPILRAMKHDSNDYIPAFISSERSDDEEEPPVFVSRQRSDEHQ